MRENKDKEFKKLKEKYEDDKRRESDQYQHEYEKLKNEIALMQRKLGQEEHYNKELAVLNNKLQHNITNVRVGSFGSKGNDGPIEGGYKTYNTSHNHFYGN